MVHLWGVGGGQRTGSIREERIKGVESYIRKVAGCGRNCKKNTQQSTKRREPTKKGPGLGLKVTGSGNFGPLGCPPLLISCSTVLVQTGRP